MSRSPNKPMPPATRNAELLAASLAFTLALSGCTEQKTATGPASAESSTSADSTSATDRWLGQWNGPEGTFLRLEGGMGNYKVTIQNLDGPQTYSGNTDGVQIRFDRNGVKESIRATSGAETGMKWLVGKSNCLTVHPGEGYCRS